MRSSLVSWSDGFSPVVVPIATTVQAGPWHCHWQRTGCRNSGHAFWKYVKCQIQNYQDDSGQGVVCLEKTKRSGKIIRGTGKLSQIPVDFASVHTASKMLTLLVSECPGGRLHCIKSFGSLSSPAILKLKTIKIKQSERKSWQSKEHFHQRTDPWSSEFFILSAFYFKARLGSRGLNKWLSSGFPSTWELL